MTSTHIVWTKKYPAEHFVKGPFSLLMSKHADGTYHASVRHFEQGGMEDREGVEVHQSEEKLESRNGKDEDSLIAVLTQWIEENLGPHFKIGDPEVVMGCVD